LSSEGWLGMRESPWIILGLHPNASEEEIMAAFDRRALRINSDSTDDDGTRLGKLGVIEDALSAIADPTQRLLARAHFHPNTLEGDFRPSSARPNVVSDLPDNGEPIQTQVLSVSPTSAEAGSQQRCLLIGEGFVATPIVRVNGKVAINTELLSSSSISFDLPSGNPGTAEVLIYFPSTKQTSSLTFTYTSDSRTQRPKQANGRTLGHGPSDNEIGTLDDLTADWLEPAYAPTKGGSTCTLHGEGFTYAPTIRIAGKAAGKTTVVNSKKIEFEVPPGYVGRRSVLVRFPSAGRSYEFPFEYLSE
jgi:curved DNA-binding protein CbpA